MKLKLKYGQVFRFMSLTVNQNSTQLKKIWDSVHDFRGVDDRDSPLKPRYIYPPRLEPNSKQAKDYLNNNGYVVIKSVLSEIEANEALNLTWDYLENLGTGIDRNNPDTWIDEKWPTVVHGGILTYHGIGQSKAQWYIRNKNRVKESFVNIWDTGNLLTSFDGMSLFRPWKLNSEWKTNPSASWLHIDQHPVHRHGFQCVQGLVNLKKMSLASGGNVLIPKSHKDFPNIIKKYPERVSKIPEDIDHFRYPPDDPLLVDNSDEKPIMCHLEIGDMLLWDSRTIHCSGPGLEEPKSSPELMRAASLICMMPRSKCPEDVIQRRKQAVLQLNSSTNWCDRWVPLDDSAAIVYHQDHEKYPDNNGYKYKLPDPPQLNSNQLKLVGFTDKEISRGDYPYTINLNKYKSRL